MLNALRKQAQSIFIQALMLIIVIVFIFWGVGTRMHGDRTTVATVNDVEISYVDFQRAYQQAVDNFQQQFGGRIPPGMIEQLGIKEQVANRLIQAELLRQGGDAMGISVSGLPIRQRIEQMKAFQKDGRFNMDQYQAILGQNRMTPASFEEGLRSDLRVERVKEQVGSFAVVSDSAVEHWLAYSEEEVKLAYLKVDPADFAAKVDKDEKKLAEWFAGKKADYRSEPKVRLKYLFFNQADDEKLVQPSDKELKARYEQEKDSYRQSEQRHARHILFKTEAGASETVRAEKKKKAEEVLALARKDKSDFAALAKEYSEDATKERGGDLGFFAAGRMVPAFDAAVFSMQAGEVIGPVETEFGYHLIKLEEIRPASERSFEQVKDNLAADLRKQEAKPLTFKRAAAAYEAVIRAGSLDKYSQQAKGQVQATDYFAHSQPPAGAPAEPAFLKIAFGLKKGELSSVAELPNGYAVIFVDDLREPELPELTAVRERALADYTKEKAAELAAKAAQDLLAAGKKQGSLQKALSSGQQLKVTDFLKRSAPAGKDAPPSQVVQDSFHLPWKEKLAQNPVQVGKVWFVYEVADRRPGGTADAAKRQQMRQELLAAARHELLSAWLSNLYAQGSVRRNDALLK